jgi:hypothetical protein
LVMLLLFHRRMNGNRHVSGVGGRPV